MKDKGTAGLLAFVVGGLGGHRFYLGQVGWGVAYLFFCWTFIPAILAFIEGIVLLTMNDEKFHNRYNRSPVGRFDPAPQNIVVNVATSMDNRGGPPEGALAQLKGLHELLQAGALTEEEFAAQKRRLLG